MVFKARSIAILQALNIREDRLGESFKKVRKFSQMTYHNHKKRSVHTNSLIRKVLTKMIHN